MKTFERLKLVKLIFLSVEINLNADLRRVSSSEGRQQRDLLIFGGMAFKREFKVEGEREAYVSDDLVAKKD